MNIDGFLHRIHSGLGKLDLLAEQISDLVTNRIERNLKAVSRMSLVDLPKDESLSLDRFIGLQEKHIKEQASAMEAKNLEIEEAVADLLELITAYQLEAGISPAPEEEQGEAARALRQAHTPCTALRAQRDEVSRLAHIKKRIGSRASGGFLFIERPFFDVDVELTIPSVSMTPSLDDIQAAINRCSRAILGCSRQLLCWGRPEERELGKTIFEDIARDKEIVKMVLLLTGGFEGVKREVMSYLETFMNYEWLWTADKNTRYKEFMKNEPTLRTSTRSSSGASPSRPRGRLTFTHSATAPHSSPPPPSIPPRPGTSPSRPRSRRSLPSTTSAPSRSRRRRSSTALKAEAAAWKAQYSINLHEQAKAELDRISAWFDEMSRLLRREVNDLDNVRAAMGYLREKDIREKEGLIDQEFGPVEEMYSMLSRYEVRVSKEEVDLSRDPRSHTPHPPYVHRCASRRRRSTPSPSSRTTGRSSSSSPTPSPTRSRTCR